MNRESAMPVEELVEELAPKRRFQPYPEYSDSDAEWLGQLPTAWRTVPLKWLFRVVNGSTPKSSEPLFWDGDIPWATPDDLGSLSTVEICQTARQITREGYANCGTTLVPAGSLVVSTRAPIGHLALAAVSLCVNQGCRCLVPCSVVHSRYFYYELLAARPELESRGQGSTFRELGKSELASLALVYPPPDEQRAIAAFLDRETARIDELIAKKQRLIELLAEKRTALISHAVTKGLNPNAPMKDSGIEWLDGVPRGWDTKRLRFAARINPVKSELRGVAPGADVSFVPMEAVCKYGGLILEQTKPLESVQQGYTYFRDGDIVVAKITPCFENGKGSIAMGLTNGVGFGTTELHVLRPQHKLDTSFLFYLTITHRFRKLGATEMYGAGGQKRVPDDFLRDFCTPLPALDEQRAIAAFLDRETARIDALVVRIDTANGSLREYRSALISAAVTGKIDLREEAASQ